MRITQISVFLSNSSGRLESLCKILADNNISISTITITETPDCGIVRLIVENPEKAAALLSQNGFSSSLVEVLAIEVDDAPGSLYKILKKAAEAGLNVEYMYALTKPLAKRPVMIMMFKDIAAAEKLFS